MTNKASSTLSAVVCDGDDAELSAWVDEIADQFEAAWQAVTRPQISHFLGEATAPVRLSDCFSLISVLGSRADCGPRAQFSSRSLAEFGPEDLTSAPLATASPSLEVLTAATGPGAVG